MEETIRLNDIKDAVRRTRLGRSKLYMEMKSGRLRSVKVGSRRLIPESALIEYIDGLGSEGTPITAHTDLDNSARVARAGVLHVAQRSNAGR